MYTTKTSLLRSPFVGFPSLSVFIIATAAVLCPSLSFDDQNSMELISCQISPCNLSLTAGLISSSVCSQQQSSFVCYQVSSPLLNNVFRHRRFSSHARFHNILFQNRPADLPRVPELLLRCMCRKTFMMGRRFKHTHFYCI